MLSDSGYHAEYDDESEDRSKMNFPQIKKRSFDFGNTMFFVTSLNGEHWVEVWLTDKDQVTPMIHIRPDHTNATIVEAFSLMLTTEQVREIMDYLRGQ